MESKKRKKPDLERDGPSSTQTSTQRSGELLTAGAGLTYLTLHFIGISTELLFTWLDNSPEWLPILSSLVWDDAHTQSLKLQLQHVIKRCSQGLATKQYVVEMMNITLCWHMCDARNDHLSISGLSPHTCWN